MLNKKIEEMIILKVLLLIEENMLERKLFSEKSLLITYLMLMIMDFSQFQQCMLSLKLITMLMAILTIRKKGEFHTGLNGKIRSSSS
uniref:Uncharacterized protein n=1 Tax=Coptotermes formosanus TaxID=36987 RepID=R4V2Y3_COPFO|nr:hypothetical protein [Coptotermes formosanus]